MKTHDFYQPLTSAQLNENLEKQFGGRVNLVKYTREELEDMRNKLRTRIFQQEGSAGINDLLTNETYQRDKAMMQLLNTRIKEMLGENIKALKDKMIELSEGKKSYKMPKRAKGSKPDFLDIDKDGNKAEPMKKAIKDKKVAEAAKPDFLDMDKDGNKAEPMKKAVKDKKATEGATKTDKPWTDMSGKKHPGTAVKGDKYTGKEAEKDEKTKKVKEGAKHPTSCDCKECMSTMESTGDYSAKKAAAGKDIGKPGKNFAKIAKKSGGGEKGERIAGAVLKKLRAKESMAESNVNFKHNVKFVNESLQFLINEDEEGKAKAITAASDIVNDFTSWMQRVGQYQTKAIIELADAIKADFGAAEAEAFKQSVAPALSATLETLTQQREAISNAVAVLAGEAAPEEPMGQEPGMDMPPEPGMDMSAPDEMNAEPAGDEFAGADAAAGAGTTGREMRESKFARKLAESHSILSKLAK